MRANPEEGVKMRILDEIHNMAEQGKHAARALSSASPEAKNHFLFFTAELIERSSDEILAANREDLEEAVKNNIEEWRMERMRLTEKNLTDLVKACLHVASVADPVGAMESQWQRPNGLLVGKMRIPIGLIAMIYEARPAVTVDAAILAIKAGNAILLKGGRDCWRSNTILADILAKSLAKAKLPHSAAQYISGGHEAVQCLCKLDELVDLIIPRGGESLVRAVKSVASVPVLMHYKGICHAYIDKGADLKQALDIVENSKSQRPGVCNALECLLVHKDEATSFLPRLAQRLALHGVEFRADEASFPLLGPNAVHQTSEDLGYEFLNQVLAVVVVGSMEEAMDFIARYGSHHTDIICTRDYGRAMRFMREVDSAMVGVNASTRFNDGGELGLGAEIGISTSKLHAFGPMGVRELTTTKFVVQGNGQIRV